MTPSQNYHAGFIQPRRAPLILPHRAPLVPHAALLAQPLLWSSFLGSGGAGAGGGGGGGGGGPSWEFLEGRNGNSISGFTGLNFGTVTGDRHLIAALGWTQGSNRDIVSVTIGGVAASQVSEAVAGDNQYNSEIWMANVPSGASGDVSWGLSTGSTFASVALGLYRASDLSSPTPVDFDGAGASSGSTLTLNLDAIAGGFVVAVLRSQSGTQPDLNGVTIDHVHVTACEIGSLETPATGNFALVSPPSTARRMAAATWF